MSRSASVDLDFGDGTYRFALRWGELAELQEKVDAGPYVVLQRLYNGTWRIEDISNVIRLGLIGGGLDPAQALRLTRTYVEGRPPVENVIPAQGILSVALLGAPEEPVGEPEAPTPEAG